MDNDPSAVDVRDRRVMWGTDVATPRLLHTALRIADIERSLRFYVDGLGMTLHDRINIAPLNITAVFVGYGDYKTGGLIELSRHWDDKLPYTHGTGFNHISIGVPDVAAMVERLEAMGAEVTGRPGPFLGIGVGIAFVKDPDGYVIELVQTVVDQLPD
jgi:lactoylglutathione lyase